MSPEVYGLLHVAGVLMVFTGLGGLFASEPGKVSKWFPAMHGLGLLVVLVAGIGFAHKSGYPWDPWLIAKIACWVVIGAVPALMKRGVLPRFAALLLVLAVGVTATWLARVKPF